MMPLLKKQFKLRCSYGTGIVSIFNPYFLLSNKQMTESKQNLQVDEKTILSLLNEAATGIFMIDEVGKIIYANRQVEVLFGYQENEMPGKSSEILAIKLHKTNTESLRAQVLEENFSGVLSGKAKDGTTLQFEVKVKEFGLKEKSFFIYSIVDKQERQEDQRAKAQLAAIVASSTAAILSKDLNGKILTWNYGAEKLLGYSASEMIGKPVERTIPADKVDEEKEIRIRVRSGEIIPSLETVRVHKNGSLIQVAISASPIKDEGNQIVATSTIILDLSAIRTVEKQLAEKIAELQRSNEDLQQFAYVCSHDLQEPLRVISNYVQLISRRYEGQLDEKGQHFLQYIVDGAVRMQQMVEDLLVYSRAGNQRSESLINLNKVIKRVQANLKLVIEENNVDFEIDGELPSIVGNETELIQVFQNLFSNAIKFRHKERPRITVLSRDDKDHWIITVKDNGIGFDIKYAQKIFVIFQRLHTRQEFPGSGIGLAICKKIVERQGGTIFTESKKGEGSSFHMSFPKVKQQTNNTASNTQ